jgi:ABC-type multidrug transport system ATPase subunit
MELGLDKHEPLLGGACRDLQKERSSVAMLKVMLWKNALLKSRDKFFILRDIMVPLYFFGILVILANVIPSNPQPENLVSWGEDSGMNVLLSQGGGTTADAFKEAMLWGKKHQTSFAKRYDHTPDGQLKIGIAPCSNTAPSAVWKVVKSCQEKFTNSTNSSAGDKFTFQCFKDGDALRNEAKNNPETMLAGIIFEDTKLAAPSFTFPVSYTLLVNASDSEFPHNISTCKLIADCLATYPRTVTGLGLGDKGAYTFPSNQQIGPLNLPTWSWMTSGFFTFQRLFEQAVLQQTAPNSSLLLDPTVQEVPWSAFSTNDKATNLAQVLGIYITLVYTFLLRANLSQIVEDKKQKIRVGLQMIGLTNGVYWGSWALTMFFFYSIIGIGGAFILKFGKVLAFTDVSILIIFFLLFSAALTFLCIALSALFSEPQVAGIGGMVLFLVMELPGELIGSKSDTAAGLKRILCLLPPSCFSIGLAIINESEIGGEGTQWSNAHDPNFTSQGFAVSEAMLAMFVDVFLYAFLAWYLNNVVPTEFGITLPWYYPLSPSYWFGSGASGATRLKRQLSADGSAMVSDIEEVSRDMDSQIGLSIRSLHKEFPAKAAGGHAVVAVKDLTLDAYTGQVFALLGHNGAGKSTTVSMLTGLYPPTSGDATLYGQSISQELSSVQRMIGVCPQHDILFPLLTVREHLKLYGTIMGVSGAQLPSLIQQYVDEVGLNDKIDQPSSSLSGGMKRKLSVAIALIGDPRVAFLDEPTSGMDPHSRRSVWTLLEKEKAGRIIVLTTHYMDEADLLGDRIAIMNKGKLRVLGSSLFLKTKFGIGYTLTLAMAAGKDASSEEYENALMTTIKKHVAKADLVSAAGTEMNLTLPLEASRHFATLFQELEDRKDELAIQEYGVSVTSLEEVFLRLAGAEEAQGPDEKDEPGSAMKQTSDLATLGRSNSHLGHTSSSSSPKALDSDLESGNDAWSLVQPSQLQPSTSRQVKALIYKRLLYARRSKKFAMLQVVLPIAMTVAGIIFAKVGDKSHAQPDLGDAERMPLNASFFNDGDTNYQVFVAKAASTQASAGADWAKINADFTAMAKGDSHLHVNANCCASPLSADEKKDVGICTAKLEKAYPFLKLYPTPWCEQGARIIDSQHQLQRSENQFAAGVVDVVTLHGLQPKAAAASGYMGYRMMINSTVYNSIPVIATLAHSALFRAL